MYDLVTSHPTLRSADRFRSFEVSHMILNPDLWHGYPDRIPLEWKTVRFDPATLGCVPDGARGVYSFVVIPGIAKHIACAYLLYVGKTERSFRTRYREYLRGQRTGKLGLHKLEMLTKWKDHLWFCYAPISDAGAISQVEDDLIAAYLPPYNRAFPASVREPMGVLRG